MKIILKSENSEQPTSSRDRDETQVNGQICAHISSEANEGDVGGNPVVSAGGAGEGNIREVDGGGDAEEALRGVWEMATEAVCPEEPGCLSYYGYDIIL
uniref:Uncharacterized protein n=1 Tax=Cucumis sativus TaxID=3659 RepID=A0A0A0L577_CUCSA